MKMRGEQTECVNLRCDLSVRSQCQQFFALMVVDILRYGPGQPESVIGGRP